MSADATRQMLEWAARAEIVDWKRGLRKKGLSIEWTRMQIGEEGGCAVKAERRASRRGWG